MAPFKHSFLLTFIGLCFLNQVAEGTTVTPPKLQDFRQIFGLKHLGPPKQPLKLTTVTNPRKPFQQNYLQDRQHQRRELPFQQPFLGVPVQIENIKQQTIPEVPTGKLYPQLPQLPKLPPVKPLTKPNETEAERAERIHKSFDRLLTFVEIVGQVDNYVSSKWKNLVKTVSNFYETEDQPSYRVSSKRIYGSCPHAQ